MTDPKVSLAVSPEPPHVDPLLQMTKPTLLIAAVLALSLSAGCLFSKKTDRPKESSAIASDNEEMLRKRWVDKRLSELAAQGVAADAARPQAEREFQEKFGFSTAKKK